MTRPTDVDLVVDALRSRAGVKKRAATQLSEALAEKRLAGTDVRSGALKVIDELAEAAGLEKVADGLAAGTMLLLADAEEYAAAWTAAEGGQAGAVVVVESGTVTPLRLAADPVPELVDEDVPADEPTTHVEDVDGVEVDMIDVDAPDEDDDLVEVLDLIDEAGK